MSDLAEELTELARLAKPFCVELIRGCPECERENDYKQSTGHECGESGLFFSTSCETFGRLRRESPKLHAMLHEPERCDGCNGILNNRVGDINHRERPCESGCCTEFYCPVCDTVCSSYGPVACPTCSSYGRWLVARSRLRRMHVNYHRRRRGHR